MTTTQLTDEATGKFIDAAGLRTHYNEMGSGPVLICLHGGGPGASGFSNFKQNLVALSAHFNEADDDNVRLGRMTEWVRWEDGTEAPVGQKLLLVDGEEFPLLELRELQITPAAA